MNDNLISVILLIIMCVFQFLIIQKRERTIIERDMEIDTLLKMVKDHAVIDIYCLKHIRQTALNAEDYETVIKCQNLINQLEDETSH